MPADKPTPERLEAIQLESQVEGPSAPPPVHQLRAGPEAPPLRWRQDPGPDAPRPEDEIRAAHDTDPEDQDIWKRVHDLGNLNWTEQVGTEEPGEEDSESSRESSPEPVVYNFGEGFTNAPIHGSRARRSWTFMDVNLLIAKITACLMFIVGIILLAFAGVMMEDLRHDDHDYECDNNYIADASLPWNQYNLEDPGRYHSDCRMLYTWSYILTIGASISLFRALLQALRVGGPSYWSVHYATGGRMDRLSYPSNIYLLRTFFSFVPFVLYSVCAVILGTSRLITGPPAWDSYRTMYIICLAIDVVSAVATLHQWVTTGIASWQVRGGRTERFTRG